MTYFAKSQRFKDSNCIILSKFYFLDCAPGPATYLAGDDNGLHSRNSNVFRTPSCTLSKKVSKESFTLTRNSSRMGTTIDRKFFGLIYILVDYNDGDSEKENFKVVAKESGKCGIEELYGKMLDLMQTSLKEIRSGNERICNYSHRE